MQLVAYFGRFLRRGTGGRRLALALRKAAHEACMPSGTAQLPEVQWLAGRGGLLGTLGYMCGLVNPRSRNTCVCSSVGSYI